MPNVLHFSKRELTRLATSPPATRRYYSDDVERGLRIEVRPSGTVHFFTRRRVKGKQRTYSPGAWPTVSVRSARLWMQNLRADLNRNAPVQDTSRGRATLADYFTDDYLENHLKIRAARSWKSEMSLFNCHIREPLGSARLVELERSDIVKMHNKIYRSVSARTANRAKILVHRIYNYAIDNGEIVTGNPAARIKSHKENTRDRFLMEHEVGRFFAALNADNVNPGFRDYVLLSLYTGARQANILAIRQSCIIPGLPTWQIPASEFKGARTHFVPLVRQAADIVRDRSSFVTGDYLFPSARAASGHIKAPRKHWTALCAAAGLDNLHPHDLRATLATWAEDLNVPETVRGKMLGHKDGGVIARYSRSTIDTVLRQFQAVADAIDTAASAPSSGTIVSIAEVAVNNRR